MEGVSFAGAEHSTPVSLKPPTDLSTPTPGRRQSRKTVPGSTTKRGEATKRGTPVASGIKKDSVTSSAMKAARPVKSLPGRRKGKGAGSPAGSAAVVYFLDAGNNKLQEMVSDQLPADLESLKLLLNEALDLRYSQEIQLEHERTPGIYIPVLDAIDYRGLLERIASATDRQNIRAIVYSKIEGIPVTPVRKLYTPTRPALTLPTLTTPAKVSVTPVTNPTISEVPTPQAAVSTPMPAVPSSSKKVKAKSTPKSVRIELPTPASEIRKSSLPKKSSLSISVTAEDVSVTSPPEEEVVVPTIVPVPTTVESEKSGAKKDKKRKREAEQEDETGPTVDTVAPIKEKAPKKRKVAKDIAVPVTVDESDTTLDAGEASSEQQAAVASRQKRRRERLEEARKAAKFAAEEQHNVKLAQSLIPHKSTAISETPSVSESDAIAEKSLSKRDRRKQAAKQARERSMTETSDALASEDVQMDEPAREEVVETQADGPAPEVAVATVSDVASAPQEVVEPVVAPTAAVHEAVEASQSVLEETKSKRKAKRRKGEKRGDADLTMDQSAQGSKVTSSNESASPAAEGEISAPEAQLSTAPVPSTKDSSSAPVAVSQVDHSKSSRRTKRKSKAEESSTNATPTIEEATSSNGIAVAPEGDMSITAVEDITVGAAGNTSIAAASSIITPADTPSGPKSSKRKVKRSLDALAEWRAKNPPSSDTAVASSQPVAVSQVTPSPVIAQTPLPPVKAPQPEAFPEAQPAQTQTATVANMPAVEEEDQSEEESEKAGTPPASSAQISLPPASQKIARLPSSSPESYPSDSEESQDAWQKAHRRLRTPGSDDLEPEGDDDEDDEDEQRQDDGHQDVDMAEEIEEAVQSRDTSEAIASFEEPEAQDLPMEVDTVEEVEESPAESTPRPASSPTPQPISASVIEEQVAQPEAEALQSEVETKEATPRPGTPSLFTSTQDPLIPPTQSHPRPAPLSLTDLAAPPSPLMPSTGVVAFQDAMEEDAVADQVAMGNVSAADDAITTAIAPTQEASDVTQSGTDSGTSQSVSQSQTSTSSPRRLRSRMRMRDGSKPESDPVKPLPMPTATPKKRGRQPKAQSQPDPVVQVSVTTLPVAESTPVEVTVNDTNGLEADSPAPTMSRKERRIAASQSRIPALSSLSADALRKGRASRFSTTNGALPINGTMSQPNRVLAPNTQSAATSDTDEDDNQETDSGSDSDDEQKDVASSLPVGLANRVAGAAPPRKSRQSLGAMKGW